MGKGSWATQNGKEWSGPVLLAEVQMCIHLPGLVERRVVLGHQGAQGLCGSHGFSQNCVAVWRESFSPDTMVTTNLCIKYSLHHFLVPYNIVLCSAMFCALQGFSLSLFSPFQALSWQTVISFESRYFICTCLKESIFLIIPSPLGFYIAWHMGILVVFLCVCVWFWFIFFLEWQLKMNFWDQ